MAAKSCNLFDLIDSLSQSAGDLDPKFVATLQEILNELAYTRVIEGGATETSEEWKSKFNQRMLAATNKSQEASAGRVDSKKAAKKTAKKAALPDASLPASLQRLMMAGAAKDSDDDRE